MSCPENSHNKWHYNPDTTLLVHLRLIVLGLWQCWMIVSQHFDMFLLVYSETTLTGESRFLISTPLRFEPGSLMTGSKWVDHWTSGTVYECSEIAGSPQVYDCPYLVISISYVFMIKLMSHIIHRPHAPNDGGASTRKQTSPLPPKHASPTVNRRHTFVLDTPRNIFSLV